MKWEFADLIHLSCHCDSYRQTISLPGVQTGKTGACKWAADGISQVPSHLVFTSQMSSLVAPTLRNYGNLLIFQRQVLSRNSFAMMCEIQPFLFYKPVYKSSWMTWIQSRMLIEADGLPRALPWVWCWTSLCYLETWIMLHMFQFWFIAKASSVHSAERDVSKCDLDALVGQSPFGSVCILSWLIELCWN